MERQSESRSRSGCSTTIFSAGESTVGAVYFLRLRASLEVSRCRAHASRALALRGPPTIYFFAERGRRLLFVPRLGHRLAHRDFIPQVIHVPVRVQNLGPVAPELPPGWTHEFHAETCKFSVPVLDIVHLNGERDFLSGQAVRGLDKEDG